jgi:hypothetical protein
MLISRLTPQSQFSSGWSCFLCAAPLMRPIFARSWPNHCPIVPLAFNLMFYSSSCFNRDHSILNPSKRDNSCIEQIPPINLPQTWLWSHRIRPLFSCLFSDNDGDHNLAPNSTYRPFWANMGPTLVRSMSTQKEPPSIIAMLSFPSSSSSPSHHCPPIYTVLNNPSQTNRVGPKLWEV